MFFFSSLFFSIQSDKNDKYRDVNNAFARYNDIMFEVFFFSNITSYARLMLAPTLDDLIDGCTSSRFVTRDGRVHATPRYTAGPSVRGFSLKGRGFW